MKNAERLKGIDVFVAVADAKSFTAAADRLNLTSSAVGKAIARLEERLGQRLFDRTTRRLAPTDAGAAFYAICVRVLEELESAEKVFAADPLEPFGRLRIDLPVTFGQRRAIPHVLEFARQHPGIQAHVSFTDRFVDILDEGIDVAVRIGGPDVWPAALAHSFIGKEHLVFCASPGYLSRRGLPADPDELQMHDTVMYGRTEGQPSPWLVGRAGGRVERRAFEPRMVLGNAEAQLAAVVGGCGVAQMATWLAEAEIANGRLVPILREWDVDGLPLHVVWPQAKQLLPKVHTLATHLAGNLKI